MHFKVLSVVLASDKNLSKCDFIKVNVLLIIGSPLLYDLHKEIAHVTNNVFTQRRKYTRLAKWKVLISPWRMS